VEDVAALLHALASRVLFAQPGGFEGGSPIRVLERVDDPAVAHLPVRVDPQVDLDSASLAASADVDRADDVLARASQVLDSDGVSFPGVEPAFADSLRPVDPARRSVAVLDRIPHEVGVEGLEERLLVIPAKGFNGSPHDLHVLRRHRPRSISRVEPGCHQRVLGRWR